MRVTNFNVNQLSYLDMLMGAIGQEDGRRKLRMVLGRGKKNDPNQYNELAKTMTSVVLVKKDYLERSN